ncbi:MAG TPA: DNA-directed RNA polymerase subunit omega [Nitrospiria bacterium]|jgi:DNA-directed RNA polymerase subunit omega
MEIVSLPIDFEKLEFDSRYRLVIIGSQRAKQLMEGAKKITGSRYTKETTVALDEILLGKVQFLVGKEARLAYKEMKRIREEDARKRVFSEEEDTSEIKKDLSVYVDDSGIKGPGASEGDVELVNESK